MQFELAQLRKLLEGYIIDGRLFSSIGQLVTGNNAVPKPVVISDNVTVCHCMTKHVDSCH